MKVSKSKKAMKKELARQKDALNDAWKDKRKGNRFKLKQWQVSE